MTRSIRARARALAGAAVVLLALASAPGALGHAVLLRTEPADDLVLERAPEQVVLRFDEPVERAFGAVRVYDARANRVDEGELDTSGGEVVAVGLRQPLPRGTYTVTWRVVSSDSHPVSGASVFHVQEPGANPAGIAAEVLDEGAPPTVTTFFTVARFLDFALLLACAGGAFALALVLAPADASVRRRLRRALAALAFALAATALAGIVLQGPAAGGFELSEAIRRSVVQQVLETRFGEVWLVQAVLAVALGVLALAGAPRLALLPAAALIVTPAVAGHASVSGALSLVSDVAHVAAASAWTGGLAFLVAALLLTSRGRWTLAADVVPRFSTLAVASVAVLVVAGVVNGYLQVRAWQGLWETGYGLLLLGKVALVLPLLALGAYNNRYAVPRLRRGIASAAEHRRFLRTVGAELGLMLAVVGVTAVLVAESPAKAEVAPGGPAAATIALGDLEANLVVDPASAGPNQIHLYLTDRSGRPIDVDEVHLTARLASKGVGPLRFDAHRLAPGHYTTHAAQLALAGNWAVGVEARRGEFESLTGAASIPIDKES